MRTVWQPDARWIEAANVSRLMRRLGYDIAADDPRVATTVREFVARTQREPEWFWENALLDMGIAWSRPYDTLLDLSRGNEWADWFVGGETNLAINCVDRHAAAHPDRPALIAETEDDAVRRYTYGEMATEVSRVANALRGLGVGVGDTVACYLPMVAEVVFAMLGTQKIGAIFIPIFSGYAPPAVRERLRDAEVSVLFTADASMRRGRAHPLKQQADEAVEGVPSLRAVIVVERPGGASAGSDAIEVPMTAGRDLWWHDVVASADPVAESVSLPAMTTALLIYTSGTTGKPKGTVHTHAGCLAQMGKELLYNFDLKAGDDGSGDTFWWFTDIGWMMGPWEIIGCFTHGATLVVFEGTPDYPEPDRLWSTVERHGVTQLGVSPTAVRMLMRAGEAWVEKHPMETLRLLGSTGEPWDPDSYEWLFDRVGRRRCPIINISGGTDIVGCFLAPLPVLPIKATSLQSPGLGMAVDVFDEEGRSVVDQVGYLVCTKPAPSMTRGLWKNREKYLETYWSRFPGVWNHGDWAKVDRDGDWFLYGRADDTLNVAGRRIGPGEMEASLIEHPAVSEAAAIGVPDDLKGTEVVCFVRLQDGVAETEALRAELVATVVAALGKVDRPKAVLFVDDLPKTRSAKIVRRLIQRRYLGETELGDLASVANPEALAAIAQAR